MIKCCSLDKNLSGGVDFRAASVYKTTTSPLCRLRPDLRHRMASDRNTWNEHRMLKCTFIQYNTWMESPASHLMELSRIIEIEGSEDDSSNRKIYAHCQCTRGAQDLEGTVDVCFFDQTPLVHAETCSLNVTQQYSSWSPP